MQVPDGATMLIELNNPGGGPPRLSISVPGVSLDEDKTAPKDRTLLFPWVVSGLAKKIKTDSQQNIRFRVFSQKRRKENDSAPKVARMLLRLWDMNNQLLGIDHSEQFWNRMVDVYLVEGGRPGAEQLFDEDLNPVTRRMEKVNTIYVYDLPSFKDPIEMAREIAHEYGHATLPPVGVYTGPEDWANGHLGERLYLKWMRDLLASGALGSADALGADVNALNGYLAKHVEPLVKRIAKSGPNRKVLAGKGPPSMEEFYALACYVQELLPPKVLARSLALMPSQSGSAFERGLIEAVNEQSEIKVRIPKVLQNTRIWLPTGGLNVSGAKVVQKLGNWSLVAQTSAELILKE